MKKKPKKTLKLTSYPCVTTENVHQNHDAGRSRVLEICNGGGGGRWRCVMVVEVGFNGGFWGFWRENVEEEDEVITVGRNLETYAFFLKGGASLAF